MGDVRDQTTRQTHGGPPPGTRVIVDVYADDAGNGDVNWSHSWRFDDNGGGGNSNNGTGTIDVPEKRIGQPGTPIDFHLHDRTSVRLSFAPDPIWVDRDPRPCPVQAAVIDPEITDIVGAPRLLRVLDRNQDECVLHYNLRFNPDPVRYHYDPDIKNGGSN